jgi:hypothetical protein
VLVISEEWSSDCRRDVPMVARLAEAAGLALRIFPRDGQKLGRGPKADPGESPNADVVNAIWNVKGGQAFQTVPTVAFFTSDLELLYTYFEFPAARRRRAAPRVVLTACPRLAQDGPTTP